MWGRKLVSVFLMLGTSLSLANEGFYSVNNIPKAPKNLKTAFDATFKIKANCSAFFVSNDGYAITALHCLEECLLKNKLIKKHVLYGTNIDVAESLKTSSPKRCKEAAISGSKKKPYLAFISSGWFNDYNFTKIPRLSNRSLNWWATLNDDFVLLKYNVKNRKCIKTTTNKTATDDVLWTIGYPMEATRNNGRNSNGKSKYVSYGRADYLKAEYLFKNSSLKNPDITRDELEMIFNQTYVFSDIDASQGNSGGPVINQDGLLVGVHTSNSAGAFIGRFHSGAHRFELIKDSLLVRFGQEVVDEIFDCK